MERSNQAPALTPQLISKGLQEMSAELSRVKKLAEGYMADLEDMNEDKDASFDFGGAFAEEPEAGEDKEMEVGEGAEEEGGEEKGPKIETKEDAKKALNEAIKDLQAVVDNLDGLLGQSEQEKEAALIKRPSLKYSSSLRGLAKKASDAIDEAHAAMKYWSYLKKAYRSGKKVQASAEISHPDLKKVADTLEQMSVFDKLLSKLGYVKKESTAVPPTRAEFSGDKWPEGKNPAEVENRAWAAGASKFDKDKKWEDARPNAAVDTRLTATDYPRDEKPYVNASLTVVPGNKFGSYWEVVDTKDKKVARVTFANIPDSIGPRNDNTFTLFASEKYGRAIVDNVMRKGIKAVATELGAKVSELTREVVASLSAVAKEPKLKDKAKVRKYYRDAFGDGGYARDLTSSKETERNQKTSAEGGQGAGAQGTKMEVEYKPKDEHPADTNSGEMLGEAKDGPGKISSVSEAEKDIIRAKARRAADLARKLASRGGIPFTKKAILDAAREFYALDDAAFSAKEDLLEKMPIQNEAALKEAHIPDSESGIVGNPREGVRTPGAQVKTENIDSNVKSDAKVSKTASVVPQVAVSTPQKGPEISEMFTTTINRLKRKGVNISGLHQPAYRRS